MARGKRALLIALLIAGSLLAALGVVARRLWLEAREVEIDLHEGQIMGLAPLGSDTVICARVDGTVEAVQIPGGVVRWRVRLSRDPLTVVTRDDFVAVGLPDNGIACLRNGQVVTTVPLADSGGFPWKLGLLPSKRPGGARLAWITFGQGSRTIHSRELTGEPDVRVGQDAQSLAATGNRVFALDFHGLLSVDPWTLQGEKVADAGSTLGTKLFAGPRGVAWYHGEKDKRLHLWRPGRAPIQILDNDDDCWDLAFDDSGELLATLDRKPAVSDKGGQFWVGLYDLEHEEWWSRELEDAARVAFVGDRLVVGDRLRGKLLVLPTPRARFQRSWQPGVK